MPVSRRTHDATVLAIHADRERIRKQRDNAIERANIAEAVVRTMGRQIDDLTEQVRKLQAPEAAS